MRPGPRAHDVDGVGEERRLAQVVRHQDDGEAELLPEVAQHAPQFLAGEGVERGERLVEHQQRRLVDQRAAERDALLHAARQLPRKAVAEAVEADGLEQRLGLLAILLPSRGGSCCGAAATISSGSRTLSITLRQGSRFGFWNAMPAILTGPRTLSPKIDDVAGVGRHQPGDELHQRRLAAAGRPDHGGELAAPRR